MKQFLKVVIWIVILGVVFFGVYTILPEYPHNFVKSFVQPVINSEAKDMIEKVQNLTNSDLNYINYKVILETHTGMSCWVYETRETEPGVEYVIYRGNGASINLKDFPDYNGKLYTSASVKVEFKIANNNVEIYPYVDDQLLFLNDGKHTKENAAIKKVFFQQVYSGISGETE